MKKIFIYALLTVAILANTTTKDVAKALKDVGCKGNYKIYKEINCLSIKYNFRENLDNTLSCYQDSKVIRFKYKPLKGFDTDIRYIYCKDANGTEACEEGFRQVDENCLKTEDNIGFEDGLICKSRELSHYVEKVDSNLTLPHFTCKPRRHIIEDILSPSNTVAFYKNTEYMGNTKILVPKVLGVNKLSLIDKGNVISMSNNATSVIAQSDILNDDFDLDDYIRDIENLKDFIYRLKTNKYIRNRLGIPHMISANRVMINIRKDKSLIYFHASSDTVFDNGLYSLLTDIKISISKLDNGVIREKAIAYILEEYYYTYSLILENAKKLEEGSLLDSILP